MPFWHKNLRQSRFANVFVSNSLGEKQDRFDYPGLASPTAPEKGEFDPKTESSPILGAARGLPCPLKLAATMRRGDGRRNAAHPGQRNGAL